MRGNGRGFDAQLGLDSHTMRPDRLRADPELGGDFGRANAHADQAKNLELTIGQAVHGVAGLPACLRQRGQQSLRNRGTHPDLAGKHALQRGQKPGGRLLLHDVPVRAVPERATRVRHLVQHGKHEDRDVRRFLPGPGDQIEPGLPAQ